MNPIIAAVLTCALVLAGTGNAMAAPASESSAALDRQASDSSRASHILASFNSNRCLRVYDLTVSVAGDSASLGGAVGSAATRALAEQVALTTAGISHVENRIQLDARATAAQQHVADRRAGLVVGERGDHCAGTEVTAVDVFEAADEVDLYGGADSAAIATHSKGQ